MSDEWSIKSKSHYTKRNLWETSFWAANKQTGSISADFCVFSSLQEIANK